MQFQPNPPNLAGNGQGQVIKAPGGGGTDQGLLGELIKLGAGIAMGVGTGNWAPLISNELGGMAGGLYSGIADGDWSSLAGGFGGGGGEKKKEGPAIGENKDGSTGGEMNKTDDPNNPENDIQLASETMTPELGQPLPQGYSSQGQMQQATMGPKPLRDPMRWLG